MGKQKWTKIGVVGVDSGQLLICDPRNLLSEWKGKGTAGGTAGYYVDDNGRAFACSLHHDKPPVKDCIMFGHYDQKLKELGGKTPNDMGKKWKHIPPPRSREFSYDGCCHASDDRTDGQLNYTLGHAGAGVCFASGYGDGVYPVFARLNRDGRIVEVKIEMH